MIPPQQGNQLSLPFIIPVCLSLLCELLLSVLLMLTPVMFLVAGSHSQRNRSLNTDRKSGQSSFRRCAIFDDCPLYFGSIFCSYSLICILVLPTVFALTQSHSFFHYFYRCTAYYQRPVSIHQWTDLSCHLPCQQSP